MDLGYPNLPKLSVPRRNWLTIGLIAVLVALTVLFVAVVVAAVRTRDREYAEFLQGCEQDHKHYECMLMWRSSRHDIDVVPLPIPVPAGR